MLPVTPGKGKGTAAVESEEVVALAEEETTMESPLSTFSVLAIACQIKVPKNTAYKIVSKVL